MKKQEFLDRLAEKLAVLNEKERSDILSEYSQHIDMKTAEGQSEEDAIADFGDPDELAREILDAYNIDPDYAKGKHERDRSFEKMVADKVSGFTAWMNRTADTLSKKSSKQIVGIVIKLILLVIVLLLLRIPVGLLTSLSAAVFLALPYSVGSAVNIIIAVLINVVYVIVVCYALYVFFKRVANDGYTGEKEAKDFMNGMNNEPYEESGAQKENTASGGEKKYHGFTWQDRTVDDVSGASSGSTGAASGGDTPKKGDSSASAAHVFGTILGVILKIIVVIIMIPVILIGIISVVGLGASIALVIQGFGVVGIMLIALGVTLCLLAIIWAVFKALFGKKRPPENSPAAGAKEV
ncbi:MAG: DUF1700 domain-containing protein [Clostridia bacterium]|nr:DUF1700 domain-containing protein [Clostridia bacterium]